MFYFDPIHMLIAVAGMALIFGAQAWVKSAYSKYSEVPASRGRTGADVAQEILRINGLSHVQVEMVEGSLSDHYDPMQKAVRLSAEIYQGRSVASVAIAAHECGHAIQHAKGYFPVVVRSALVPAVNLGSQLGPLLIMVALGLGATAHAMPEFAWNIAWLGVALYGAAVLFHFVTLPVEIDASSRALTVLNNGNYLTPMEMPGAKTVLTAAAFTYVATALYALMELVYWVMRLLGNSRRD